MTLKNKLCLNCLYYKMCRVKCVKDEYQHNIISICKGSYYTQNHTFNNSSIPGIKPKYTWKRECETLGRRTASQNVAQLLLTVMNHKGLKWLPKCGTISADCGKLHMTQIASSTITAVIIYTQLKWLPKCGTITADCDKLHRTQMASKMWHNYC